MIKSGALGELAAMKHFLGLGYEVYTAVTDSSTYDIILRGFDPVEDVIAIGRELQLPAQ